MPVVTPPTITALPSPPDPNNRATFNALAYPWSVALSPWTTQVTSVANNVAANATDAATSSTTATTQAGTATTQAGIAATQAAAAAASAVAASSQATAAAASAASAAAIAGALVGTSTTSLAIGAGNKTFTTQAGEQYTSGIFMTAVSAANTANYMGGQVVSYSGTTLVLGVSVTGGSGTYADWNLSIAGPQGPTGPAGPTFTGGSLADNQLSRAMFIDCGYTFLDKGNSGTTTQTIDYTVGQHQRITVTGAFTIATSNWPPTGNLGEQLLELTNGGAFAITWPVVNWKKPDGTFTTSIATYLAANTGRTGLQASGTDFVLLWSRDAGTTIYGVLV